MTKPIVSPFSGIFAFEKKMNLAPLVQWPPGKRNRQRHNHNGSHILTNKTMPDVKLGAGPSQSRGGLFV
jgi:hypothetical protein